MKQGIIVVIALLLFVAIGVGIAGCERVPVGYAGIKVNLLGSEKGVDSELLSVGRYWLGWNEELHLYPTYQVNYVYTRDTTEASPTNEEFTFQTREGMECSVDLGVAMRFEYDKLTVMYQTYHKGEEEIRGVVVRNTIRDALNKIAGTMPVEYVYGEGKGKLIDSVLAVVRSDLAGTGIGIDKIFLIGSIRIPQSVKNALDAKVKMTQDAQTAENEVRKAEAEAKIKIAQAEGNAQSVLVNAKAQAEANRAISASITPTLVNYMAVQKWNGALPTYSGGGAIPFINIK
jgi:regulator of protease activity HflC (stomatin/prohibitin superfamily)